jgi:hypothetical protein
MPEQRNCANNPLYVLLVYDFYRSPKSRPGIIFFTSMRADYLKCRRDRGQTMEVLCQRLLLGTVVESIQRPFVQDHHLYLPRKRKPFCSP